MACSLIELASKLQFLEHILVVQETTGTLILNERGCRQKKCCTIDKASLMNKVLLKVSWVFFNLIYFNINILVLSNEGKSSRTGDVRGRTNAHLTLMITSMYCRMNCTKRREINTQKQETLE